MSEEGMPHLTLTLRVQGINAECEEKRFCLGRLGGLFCLSGEPHRVPSLKAGQKGHSCMGVRDCVANLGEAACPR